MHEMYVGFRQSAKGKCLAHQLATLKGTFCAWIGRRELCITSVSDDLG